MPVLITYQKLAWFQIKPQTKYLMGHPCQGSNFGPRDSPQLRAGRNRLFTCVFYNIFRFFSSTGNLKNEQVRKAQNSDGQTASWARGARPAASRAHIISGLPRARLTVWLRLVTESETWHTCQWSGALNGEGPLGATTW